MAIGTPGGRVYVMFCDSEGERKTWMEILVSILGDNNPPKNPSMSDCHEDSSRS